MVVKSAAGARLTQPMLEENAWIVVMPVLSQVKTRAFKGYANLML